MDHLGHVREWPEADALRQTVAALEGDRAAAREAAARLEQELAELQRAAEQQQQAQAALQVERDELAAKVSARGPPGQVEGKPHPRGTFTLQYPPNQQTYPVSCCAIKNHHCKLKHRGQTNSPSTARLVTCGGWGACFKWMGSVPGAGP